MLKTAELSTFDQANLFFDNAEDRLGLANGLREMLKRSWRELQVQIPVRMDDGQIQVFSSTTVPSDPTRTASATIRRPILKKCAHWPF